MSQSRLRNSINNISTGMLFRVLTLLMNFVSRTVFIRVLGDGCLGLNGLFTSILSMFSLAELGIGQAITFYLYKPLAERDERRVNSLIKFYKVCYRIIGIAIIIVGILLIPFLHKLVNMDIDTGYNLYYIYLLYLANTAITYLFFSYPQTLLSADQKQYIINKNESVFVIASAVGEIIVLLISHNFVIYLITKIMISVLKNVFLLYKVIKIYPYIIKKEKDRICKNEIRTMFKDVYAVFVVKLSSQLFNSTDNLFISSMFGTILAGYNSNYLLIINALYGITGTLIYSFGGSVGNLYATESKDKTEKIFSIIDYINRLMSCIFTTCLFVLLNHFIKMFWGEKYLFSMISVGLMCASYYMVSSLYALFSFRQSMGLFRYCIYNQLFAAIVNIILDYILGKSMGINGLFLSTVVANICFAIFPYAINLYKVGFKQNATQYCLRILWGYIITFLTCFISYKYTVGISETYFGFVLKGIICIFISLIIFVVFNLKDRSFIETKNYFKSIFKIRKKRM